MAGKYVKIFHLGVGDSTGPLKANWKVSLPTPLKTTCGQYPKSLMGREGYVMCLILSGSVCRSDIALV